MADIQLEDLLKNPAKTEVREMDEKEARDLVKEELPSLSGEDQKKVNEIKEGLDLKDSMVANLYAVSTQKDIAQFSEEILGQVRSRDSGSVGRLLTDLLVKVKNSDQGEGQNFLERLFQGGKNKIERLLAGYDDLAGQIDGITAKLQTEQADLLKQVELFDRLYQQNLDYYHDLSLYITAGEQKIEEIRTQQLPRLVEEAKNSDHPMASQVVSDFSANVDRFEKKIHDLKVSQTLAMQSAPQIKLIQNNDQLLANKITDAINHTIPLWKSQTVIALGLAKQDEVLRMQRDISDATNTMIRENAKKLKQTTLGVREEAERSTVDIETLEEANKELIDAIQGSLEVSKKAKEQRQQAAEKMTTMREDLKKALMAAMAENQVQ